jgi:hypothetical protein
VIGAVSTFMKRLTNKLLQKRKLLGQTKDSLKLEVASVMTK